jgi:hypothetical protein
MKSNPSNVNTASLEDGKGDVKYSHGKNYGIGQSGQNGSCCDTAEKNNWTDSDKKETGLIARSPL